MFKHASETEYWQIPKSGPLTIGREHDCDIVINDRAVSRVHARIYWQGKRCMLEDLGSRNGTYVDGRRIKSAIRLLRGDKIRFASCLTLVFKYTRDGAVLTQIA